MYSLCVYDIAHPVVRSVRTGQQWNHCCLDKDTKTLTNYSLPVRVNIQRTILNLSLQRCPKYTVVMETIEKSAMDRRKDAVGNKRVTVAGKGYMRSWTKKDTLRAK